MTRKKCYAENKVQIKVTLKNLAKKTRYMQIGFDLGKRGLIEELEGIALQAARLRASLLKQIKDR